MKKNVVVFLLLILTCGMIFAEKPTIVVMNFDTVGVDKEIGVVVSEMFRVYFQHLSTNFTVIERSKLNDILKEQQLQLSGAVSEDDDGKIGELLGANYMVVGSVNKVGNILLIQSRIINIKTGEVENSGFTQSPGLDVLPLHTKELTLIVLGQQVQKSKTVSDEALDVSSLQQLVPEKKKYIYDSWYTDSGGKHTGGKIVLIVEGDKVSGISIESYGKAKMRGSIQENIIVGYYKAAYGHGNFEFTIKDDWKKLVGKYYQVSNGASGEWSGVLKKITALKK